MIVEIGKCLQTFILAVTRRYVLSKYFNLFELFLKYLKILNFLKFFWKMLIRFNFLALKFKYLLQAFCCYISDVKLFYYLI